jgi:hypothetical protein
MILAEVRVCGRLGIPGGMLDIFTAVETLFHAGITRKAGHGR